MRTRRPSPGGRPSPPSTLALVTLAVAALLASCGGEAEPRRTLVLTGSSTVAPLAVEIGRRFEAAHPGVRIDVQTGGSSRGIADARAGTADVGMVSRALRPSESDLVATTIARDGIALIVHADNPVATLTDEQVVAIYTGTVQRWSEVGGSDAPVTVVHKAAGRSTHELFVAHFGLDPVAVAADVVIGDNEQGVKTVAGDRGALGYVSIGTAEYDAAHGVPIRMLPLGGVGPSTGAVAEGSYPLSRPLNLVTRGEPRGLAAEFTAFAASPAVRDLIESLSFVPLPAGSGGEGPPGAGDRPPARGDP